MLGVFTVKTAERYECVMHFQVKMVENRFKNIFPDKQTTNNVPLMFLDVKVLTKGNNYIFRLSQQTRKVQCTYLTLKNIKIRSKKGHQWSETLKQSTNYVF